MRQQLTLLVAGVLIACSGERPDFGQPPPSNTADGGTDRDADASLNGSGPGGRTDEGDAQTSSALDADGSAPSGSSGSSSLPTSSGEQDAEVDAGDLPDNTATQPDAGGSTQAGATSQDDSEALDGGTTSNDSGGQNTGTWCDEQTPLAINAGNFQCLDFETEPALDVWVPEVTGAAAQRISTERAFSLPTSFSSTVPSADVFADRAVSTISWTNVGATPVTGVRLALRVNPDNIGSLAPLWTGSIALACVEYGSGSACLHYTRSETRTGLFVDWIFTGGPAILGECVASEQLTFDLWNDVELGVDGDGRIDLTINGEQAVTDCIGTFGSDTVALYEIGLQSFNTTSQSWTVFFDDVVAETLR